MTNNPCVYYTGEKVSAVTVTSIDCSDASSISFDIFVPDVGEWEGSGEQSSWSLNGVTDEACEPTFNMSHGLVSYSNIDVSVCDPGDPSLTPDNSTFEFEFIIQAYAREVNDSSPVTFAYDHYYSVKCLYNKEQKNVMASFQPRHTLAGNDSGKSKSINLNNNQPLLL